MTEMRVKVIAHFKRVARTQPQYKATRFAELAPGIIAVEDASGECDAFFDPKVWQFASPKFWEGLPESPVLQKMGLRVLPGAACAPTVGTVGKMVWFAKHNLEPVDNATWHAEPQFFTA